MARLLWDPVTTYSDGSPIADASRVEYRVWWKTPTVGYNSADFKLAGNIPELDLGFLSPDKYDLAVSALLGSLESVRSIDLPFVNIPPASPSGLHII